jgi:hypothetical protein
LRLASTALIQEPINLRSFSLNAAYRCTYQMDLGIVVVMEDGIFE